MIAVAVAVIVSIVFCSAIFGVVLWLFGRAVDYDDKWRN